jgi:hypothetical protein
VVDFLDTYFRWEGKGIEPPGKGDYFWDWISKGYVRGRAAGPLSRGNRRRRGGLSLPRLFVVAA